MISIVAPGSSRESLQPQSTRIVLQPNPLILDHHCVLRLPTPSVKTRLELHVRKIAGLRYGHKLFLRQLDGTGPRLIPQRHTIQPGVCSIELNVPAGTYAIDALPMGEYRFDPATIVVNKDAKPASVFADRVEARMRLELHGISHRFLPLRISPLILDSLASEDPGILFLGPSHWSRLAMDVAPLRQTVRLVAFGRNSGFISTDKVNLEGEQQEVEMQPATFVRLEWRGLRDLHGAVATVNSDHRAVAKTFQPELIHVGGSTLPGWVCTCVLPRGPLHIEVHSHEGSKIWMTDVVADRARLRVIINGQH